MTSLTAHPILLQYFLQKDSLNFDAIKGLIPKDVPIDEGEAALLSSLEDLTNNNILYKSQTDSKNLRSITWVLKKNLAMLEQSVQIDGITSLRVADAVNQFSSTVENDSILSNPLQIKCQDIQILLEVIDLLSQNDLEEEDDTEEPTDEKSKK